MMTTDQIKLASALVIGGALFYGGWLTHGWKVDAGRLRDTEVAKIAANKAAEAIANITVTNTTIKQTLEREIHANPVYLGCNHTPDGLRLINAALVGARDSELPAPGAAQ